VVEVNAQPIKPTKVPLRYPYIIYFSFEHCALDSLRKTKVQNMFRTKPTTIAIVVTKNPQLNNVPVNVVVVIMTHSQVPKQQVLRECEPLKVKTIIDWQIEEQLRDSFVHIIKEVI